MTRSAAREIAVHFTFELGFSDLSADQLLERDLTPEFFALLGEEEPLYAQFPDKIQLEYIEAFLPTGRSWTMISPNMPKAGVLPGLTGWRRLLCG
mgnify:CR=1 FL=1